MGNYVFSTNASLADDLNVGETNLAWIRWRSAVSKSNFSYPLSFKGQPASQILKQTFFYSRLNPCGESDQKFVHLNFDKNG